MTRRASSGRRTNVALLLLAPSALATGALAFATGSTPWSTAVVVLHGMVGLGLVVASPRKSQTVRRGVRRARPGRWASILLAVLAVTTVMTGVAHTGGLVGLPFGLTTMQLHVGAALSLAPLLTWHALSKPSRPRRTDLSRRALLRTAAAGCTAGLAWLTTEAVWAVSGARGSRRRETGSHERGSGDPATMPVTQWLFDPVAEGPAAVELADARGRRTLEVADLDGEDVLEAVLDCTGGWYARQRWAGMRLDRVLQPAPGDRSVVVTSVTGYRRRFGVTELDRLLLATRCAGAPLSQGHGAPVRLVAPGRRGFHWVKWVAAVELDEAPPWAQPPFPLQ